MANDQPCAGVTHTLLRALRENKRRGGSGLTDAQAAAALDISNWQEMLNRAIALGVVERDRYLLLHIAKFGEEELDGRGC